MYLVIKVPIDVDSEWIDKDHPTGLTEQGFKLVHEENSFGELHDAEAGEIETAIVTADFPLDS